ncbi:uncharacterized protein N7484_000496 [Penicillium longicatenatum]|uniref:uncharacterized protein n=1 Tax=Penicillium longicatenatum TaxID=1561947 RepID=UPI002548355D|nr:uncharacterized protein N7484_000496 [Penicillium longicatenatum]KAJ5661124.1 hypothetical protein N7484_000496 [Penicillium longicatenatum]
MSMDNTEPLYAQEEGHEAAFFSPLSPPMDTDPFDMHINKDWESLPTTLSGNIEYWGNALQYTVPAEPLHPPVGSIPTEDLSQDPSFEAPEVDLNAGFHSGLYSNPSTITPPFQIGTSSEPWMDFSVGSEPDNPMLDYSAHPDYFSDHNHNHNDQHQALESLYDANICFENPLHTPFLTPPPTASTPSCLAEHRTSCIITATHYLRTLHIRQTSCLFRNQQAFTDQEIDEHEPRMSGSVLKCNKEAGMSVCRMLQCACALRPQNQLLLASICSRLIVWYQAMIRACFPRRMGSGSNGRLEESVLAEKVVHEAVTIGDHMVDNPALGWNIQSQVILGELGHLQRLVDTISVRIRQTGADGSSVGLPGVVHDRLVTHLNKEVQAVRNDLIMALG